MGVLFRCSQLLQAREQPVHLILEELLKLLSDAWVHPEKTAARIVLAEMEFATPNFAPTDSGFRVGFTTKDQLTGFVEIIFLHERPGDRFQPVERELVSMVADLICAYLNRRYDEGVLSQAEANQRVTIDNTNFVIWSVNREYELISFNRLFVEIVRKRYGVSPVLGRRVTDGFDALNDVRNGWIDRYNRALAGEAFKVTLGKR